MHALILQVNMGTSAEPKWNKINTFMYDPSATKRIWNKEDGSYSEYSESAKRLALNAIRAWSVYHSFIGRQFRVIKSNMLRYHDRAPVVVLSTT